MFRRLVTLTSFGLLCISPRLSHLARDGGGVMTGSSYEQRGIRPPLR
jgi:hypothetical protein